jgi:hypothetical protein
MPFLELCDETLDINSTENYDLSVQISFDRLSFCVLDTIRKKFVLMREFEPENQKYLNHNTINEYIKKDDFLGRHFRKVHIVTPSPKYTLVPAPLYDADRKEDYFTFNHIGEDGSLIFSDKLVNPDSFIVYSLPEQLARLLDEFFPGGQRMHHIKPLLTHISDNKKAVHGNYVHVHIEKEFFNIIIFGYSTLKLCNSYNYRSGSDILYFILSAFRNLDIGLEETLYISGLTKPGDDFSLLLSGYLRNLRYSMPTNKFSFSYVFNETGLHRYINLFSSVTCEY